MMAAGRMTYDTALASRSSRMETTTKEDGR